MLVAGLVLRDVVGLEPDHDGDLTLEVEKLAASRSHHVAKVCVERGSRLVEVGRCWRELGHEFVDPAAIGQMGGNDLGGFGRWEMNSVFNRNPIPAGRDQLIALAMGLSWKVIQKDPSEFRHWAETLTGYGRSPTRIRALGVMFSARNEKVSMAAKIT